MLQTIPQFNWIIGTNIDFEDIKEIISSSKENLNYIIKAALLQILFIAIFIFFLFLIESYFLSKKVQSLLENYQINLKNEINKSLKKDKILQEQSKLAAMGEMVGAIAHQWRQPLNSLSLNMILLKLEFDSKTLTTQKLDEIIEKNNQIIKYLSNTIEDFRNFFKKEKEKREFSVRNSIDTTIKIMDAKLKDYNIEVIIKGEDFKIKGYPNEFQQVILNIINNAIDALKEEKEKTIQITLIANSKEVIIKDSGKGIEEDKLKKIFNPDFTTKKDGSGIGLYISKIIIHQMNGKIEARNNKGAEFIIKFY